MSHHERSTHEHSTDGRGTAERWLAAVWQLERDQAPPPPTTAVEIGCGVVVLERAWEQLDEATAQWCFERLPPADDEPNWMHRRREAWLESGEPWEAYLSAWATEDGLHRGEDMLAALAARLRPTVADRGPSTSPAWSG